MSANPKFRGINTCLPRRVLPLEVHSWVIYDNWTGWGELEAVASLSCQGACLKPHRTDSQVSKAVTFVDDDAAQPQLFLYTYVSESRLWRHFCF